MALQLTPIAFGTGSFRGLYREVPDDEAIQAIHAALDCGRMMIDTAPWYGEFQAESIVGRALQGRPRSDYLISTKVALWSVNRQAVRGYRRDEVLWSFEGSLNRLGLESVDLIHIHDPLESEFELIVSETYPTVASLKEQGLVGAMSIGTGTLAAAERLADVLPLDCVMIAGRYTLLDQSALPFLNRLADRGTPAIAAGIYSTGILATGAVPGAKFNYGDAPPDILERVRQLEAVCARHQVSLKSAAAQFVRAHPAHHSIVMGIESPAQLHETLAAFDSPIPPEFWHELKSLHLIHPESPIPEASS